MDMNDERVIGEVEVVPGVKIPMVKRGSIKSIEVEVGDAQEKYYEMLDKPYKKESKENDFKFESISRKEEGAGGQD